jgi:hypothetical protein
VDEVRHLLVPLGPLPLVVKQKLSLAAFRLAGFALNLALSLVEHFSFLFKLLLVLLNLAVALTFGGLQLLLESFELVRLLFKSFLQIRILTLLISAGQLQALGQLLLFTLKLLHFRLMLRHIVSMLILDLTESLRKFGLHLRHDCRVALLRLGFRITLDSLKLIDRRLEFLTRLIEISFGLVALLFQEGVSALPKRLFLV